MEFEAGRVTGNRGRPSWEEGAKEERPPPGEAPKSAYKFPPKPWLTSSPEMKAFYLFIWLLRVLVTHVNSLCSCGMWDLVP